MTSLPADKILQLLLLAITEFDLEDSFLTKNGDGLNHVISFALMSHLFQMPYV